MRPRSRGRIPPAPLKRPRVVRNVLLISPTDFTGNTALHVYAIARELRRRGYASAVAVPAHPETVNDVGRPDFPVVTFRETRRRLTFEDGRGPDLVHAFTPRRGVRGVTLDLVARHGCSYVVHLEDNEEAVGNAADRDAAAFVRGAAGVTAVVDRLLEFIPPGVPHVVAWPGFDEAVLTPARGPEATRADLGVRDALTLVYNGNVHAANVDEVASLYAAVADLRASGHGAVLVRTGWNFVPSSRLPRLGDALIELGWIARRHIPDLLAAADVLVQPGRPSDFNDYRFPAKVPEFLASGRPVVLPRTNIGLHLRDGEEALLLDRGDSEEIAAKVELLALDVDLRDEIGRRGRAFALRELRWARAGDCVGMLYATIERVASSAAVR